MKHLFRYTVQRSTSTGKHFGNYHGSLDAEKTLCGKEITNRWYIITNDFSGEITCRECIRWDKRAYIRETEL